MCGRVILVFLLLQVNTCIFGYFYCVANRKFPKIHGFCAKQENCLTETTFNCGSTGLSCCPPIGQSAVYPRMTDFNCGYSAIYKYYKDYPIIYHEYYSWIVSLEYNHTRDTLGVCAGSIISSHYVITAAHCVVGAKARQYGEVTAVRLPDFALDENGQQCDFGGTICESYQRFVVGERIPHPDYREENTGVHVNDIALLKLNREIQFSAKLRPICLPSLAGQWNGTLTAIGWGSSLKLNHTFEKRIAELNVLNNTKCVYSNKDKHICAGSVGNNNTCESDSGAPLMRFEGQMVLEGIVSQGNTFCDSLPVIGTSVRNFLDWIKQYVQLTNLFDNDNKQNPF